MPFESEAQRRWMWANKPEMAREWEAHTPQGPLPEHVQERDKVARRTREHVMRRLGQDA